MLATVRTVRKPKFSRLPKIGDKVTPVGKGGRPEYPNGAIGRCVEIIDGACGPIVVVEFPGYGNQHGLHKVDLGWKKVRVV